MPKDFFPVPDKKFDVVNSVNFKNSGFLMHSIRRKESVVRVLENDNIPNT